MKFNRIILGGRLTRDPEQRTTQSGKTLVEFGLAVNGFKEDDVLFIDCTAWDKTGDTIAEHFGKGDPILLEGRLDFRSWEDKEGNRRSKHSFTVERFSFAGGGKQQQEAKKAATRGEEPPADCPF